MNDDEARYSKVSRRMWNDEGFRKLSAPREPNAQHLWFRILTGPELSVVPGCFQAWDAGLARALGWPIDGTHACFEEIVAQGMAKADWEVGFIFVPNAIKHNKPTSTNVVKSWRKTWMDLPECALKNEAYQRLKGIVEAMGDSFAKAFAWACRIQEQEQEQEQEQDPPTPSASKKRNEQVVLAKQVFDVWRETHGHERAVFDRKRQGRIIARLDEGFTVGQLCSAVRGAKHDPWLMGKDPKNSTVYDDIQTILRDASQVEKLMRLDRPAAPPPSGSKKPPVSRRVDPDEEAHAARTRNRLATTLETATPEQLRRAAELAGGIRNLTGRLMK